MDYVSDGPYVNVYVNVYVNDVNVMSNGINVY